jgi:DNA-binding transcriptional ArsR family regulator
MSPFSGDGSDITLLFKVPFDNLNRSWRSREEALANRVAKDALFDGLASIAKALASGRRAEIIDVLAQGERSVEELAGEINQSIANTSHHLQILSRAGLVRTHKQGTWVYYRLADQRVSELWSALTDVACNHVAGLDALVGAYLGDHADVPQISRDELSDRLGSSDLLVLDVRPTTEYDAGHIPSAESVPIGELEDRLTEIPPGTNVVAYCRGPYCVYAVDAVRMLTAHGVAAQRLEDGLPEWRLAGLPVEVSGGTEDVA